MSRRIRNREEAESLDVFQSFTDLMSNAFLIMTFFVLLIFLQSIQVNGEFKKLQTAPPIIIDERSLAFSFPSGGAELPSGLRDYIANTVVTNIEKTIENQNIEFIQIIGHTDAKAVKNTGNLDLLLEDAARGNVPIAQLKAGSNIDLGLMRAVAVLQELRRSRRLNNVSFRAYSAGQLYLAEGQTSDASRRRIEIRFIPPGQKN